MRNHAILALLVAGLTVLLVGVLWLALAATQAAVIGILTPNCPEASCSL